MKKLTAILLSVLMLLPLCLVGGGMAVSSSATTNVVYVEDGGSGDGSSATAPYGSLTDAYNALGDEGGRIVICGTYSLSANFTEPSHAGEVVISQLHDDVDYRTGGALTTGSYGIRYILNGPTTFENIKITGSNYLLFIAQNNPITMGDGITCEGFTYSKISNGVTVLGGRQYDVYPETDRGYDTHINIKSGKFIVVGMNRQMHEACTGTANINISGGEIVTLYGGSVNAGSTKNSTINVTGGRFTGAFHAGETVDGALKVNIAGGDFSKCTEVLGGNMSYSVINVSKAVEATVKAKISGFLLINTSEGITRTVAGYGRGYRGGRNGSGEILAHGLDVSTWQDGNIDFNAVKAAGYSFVIIRCGYSGAKDRMFEQFYAEARAAGLDIGVYYYSYALSAAEAYQDALDTMEYIKGKKFEYPIWIDYEDESQKYLSDSLDAAICLTYMDTLARNGYLTGLYTFISMSAGLPMDTICKGYDLWIAHYYDYGYTAKHDTYCSTTGMYQYTDRNYVSGSGGPYDANVAYKDFPSIVQQYGFNGYDKSYDALGHELSTVAVAADCGKEGCITTTCSTCDLEEVFVLPALEHVISGNATCTKAQKCENCGEIFTDALGHDNHQTIETLAPTEHRAGYTTYTCSVCSETYTVWTDATDGIVLFVDTINGTAQGNGTKEAPFNTYTQALKYADTSLDRTIVLMNMVSINTNYTETYHTGTYTVTSEYGGVDYPGGFDINGTSHYLLNGPDVFENINIDIEKTSVWQARFNKLVMGEGIVCTGANGLYILGGVNTNNTESFVGKGTDITLLSGTYLELVGGNRNGCKDAITGDINVHIGGSATVNKVFLTSRGIIGNAATGNVSITLDGGVINYYVTATDASTANINATTPKGEITVTVTKSFVLSDSFTAAPTSDGTVRGISIANVYTENTAAALQALSASTVKIHEDVFEEYRASEKIDANGCHEIISYVPVPVWGDFDADGVLTNSDIVLLIRYLSGWNDPDVTITDVTADGKINNRDVIALIVTLSH